jgi:hypothetical protein
MKTPFIVMSMRFMSMGLCSLLLTACSRTVQWEEEVSLNTGETIWVKRSGTYTFKPAPGSPLDYGWGGDPRSTIEFNYKGKSYSYTGEASFMLLTIAPDGLPNLVADARAWGNANKYPCVTPYYVQFLPDQTGKRWNWPQRIEPWLYGQPTNLIFGLVPLASSGNKFSGAERQQINASLLGFADHFRRIDPGFKPENCVEIN